MEKFMAKNTKTTTPLKRKPQVTPAVAVQAVKTAAAPKAKLKPATKPITKPMTEAVVKAVVDKVVKTKAPKPMRDSFTIPKTEYAVLGELKERAANLTHSVKKSELLRAGIKALAAMTDANFLSAVKAVPAIKTGRPKK
jgi:hypothetical protein